MAALRHGAGGFVGHTQGRAPAQVVATTSLARGGAQPPERVLSVGLSSLWLGCPARGVRGTRVGPAGSACKRCFGTARNSGLHLAGGRLSQWPRGRRHRVLEGASRQALSGAPRSHPRRARTPRTPAAAHACLAATPFHSLGCPGVPGYLGAAGLAPCSVCATETAHHKA